MKTRTGPAKATAAAGIAVVVLGTLLAGMRFPGYSHARQYISELGARGAPDGVWVTWGMFLPAGLLLTAFAWQASRRLPCSVGARMGLAGVALYAFGYLASVPFRCAAGCRADVADLQQALHNLVGGISYLCGAMGLIVLGIAARRWPQARGLVVAGIGGGVLSLFAFGGLSQDFAYAGFAQRLIEGSMLLWIGLCARYLGRGMPVGDIGAR